MLQVQIFGYLGDFKRVQSFLVIWEILGVVTLLKMDSQSKSWLSSQEKQKGLKIYSLEKKKKDTNLSTCGVFLQAQFEFQFLL